MAAFLKSVQNSGISEVEFVERYVQVPYSGKKGYSGARSQAKAKYQYRSLVKNFDFFAPKA
jgi:hypothetical protein